MEKKGAERSTSPVPQYVSDAVTEYLSTFDSLTRKPEEVLKGNRLPAHFDIHSPAHAKGNRQTVKDAGAAARDHSLSPQFQAVRGKWSDKLQVVLLIPESKYVEEDPELYRVAWASDGSEMRVDLAEALVPRQWGTPTGWIRRVKVTLYRNLPVYGSALVLDLPGGELREDPEVERERKKRKAAKAAGAQAAAKGEQSAPAQEQPQAAPEAKPSPGQQPEAKPEPGPAAKAAEGKG